jgi:hypothetical protein
MTKNLTATFKAYQGADRDTLVERLAGIDGWSHIGQTHASAEINCIEVKVHFRKDGKRVRDAIRRETLFGAWKIQAFN